MSRPRLARWFGGGDRMSAARGCRVHFEATEDVPAAKTGVPLIGPVIFTVQLGGTDHLIDLSALPCPRLTRSLAEALSRTAGDGGTQRTPRSVDLIADRIRKFVRFAAATDADDADEFSAPMSPRRCSMPTSTSSWPPTARKVSCLTRRWSM